MKIFEVFISLVTLIGGVNSAITGHEYVSFNEITENFIQDSANNIDGIFDYSGSEIIDNNSIENKYNQDKEDKKDFDLDDKNDEIINSLDGNIFLKQRIGDEWIIKDGYGVCTYEDSILLGDKNKVFRMVEYQNPYDVLERLRLEESDYNDTKDFQDTYGYLIGKDPLNTGDLETGYEYETALINGAAVQYPNFLIFDKNYGLDDKSAIYLRNDKDGIKITLGNKDFSSNDNVQKIVDSENEGKEVIDLEVGDDWYSSLTRNGNYTNYKFAVLTNERLKYFVYSFKYEDLALVKPMIEQSCKTFEIFNEYPNNLMSSYGKERNSHYPEEEDEGYKVELNGEKLEIGDKNQIIRLVIPKNMGETNEPMLELEPVTDYEAEKEKSDTYGFLIGKNPLEKGDMYGDWHFNTVVLPGFIVKYPNFLNLSRKYFKVGISTLSFRSDDYEYGIMVNRYDVNGSSIKEIYDNFSKGASESELGDNWVYTYRNAADKDHFNYTVLDRGMTKDIIGSFPRQYKDIFDEVIEAGKQSLKICNEFPK